MNAKEQETADMLLDEVIKYKGSGSIQLVKLNCYKMLTMAVMYRAKAESFLVEPKKETKR